MRATKYPTARIAMEERRLIELLHVLQSISLQPSGSCFKFCPLLDVVVSSLRIFCSAVDSDVGSDVGSAVGSPVGSPVGSSVGSSVQQVSQFASSWPEKKLGEAIVELRVKRVINKSFIVVVVLSFPLR